MPAFTALFQPSYYLSILEGKTRSRWWLRALLITLATLLPFFIIIYTKGIVFADRFENDARTIIERIYPAELEITIQDGQASTNVPEPYFILISKETYKDTFLENELDKHTYSTRLLTIDTKARAEQFESYQTAVLLTANALVYVNDGEIKVSPLREVQNMTINKTYVTSLVNEIFTKYNAANIIRTVIYAGGPIVLILFFIGYIFRFLMLALFAQFIAKVLQVQTKYSRLFGTLIAITFLPDLFIALLGFLPQVNMWVVPFQGIIGLFMFAFIYLLLKQLPQQKGEQ